MDASPATDSRGSNRWLRAVGYGLLAEVSTVITIIIAVTVNKFAFARGAPPEDYARVAEHIGAIVGPVGGALFTLMFAHLLMRRISARFVAHGLLVALAAIALSIGGSIAGHHAVPAAYIPASVLKLVAGAFAGFLATRRPK